MDESQIKAALKAVKYPGYSRDIVSFGLVKDIAFGNGSITAVVEDRKSTRLNSSHQ